MKYIGREEDYKMRRFMIFNLHQMSFGWWNQEEWEGWDT